MTDDTTLAIHRCPACGRPTPEKAGSCLHCGANLTTGKVEGSGNRIIDDPKGLALGCGGLLAVVLALAVGWSALKPDEQPQAATAVAAPTEEEVAAAPPATTYTAFQRSMICRAGIAAEFGRDPKIMTATPVTDDILRVAYRRPDDNKLWKNDCRIEGDRIVWRTFDAFPGDGPGRWRTTDDDDVLTFTIIGKAVTTQSNDGSSASETYRF